MFISQVKTKYVLSSVDGWTDATTKSIARTIGNDEKHYLAMLSERKRVGTFNAKNVKAFIMRQLGNSYSDANWQELAEHFQTI